MTIKRFLEQLAERIARELDTTGQRIVRAGVISRFNNHNITIRNTDTKEQHNIHVIVTPTGFVLNDSKVIKTNHELEFRVFEHVQSIIEPE